MSRLQEYHGKTAERVHKLVERKAAEILRQMLPGFDLERIGIERDRRNEDVRIVLHMKKSGRVK